MNEQEIISVPAEPASAAPEVPADALEEFPIWEETITAEPAPVILPLETQLNDLSTTDFLLLLILCVLVIRTAMPLFLRKWGFPE